MSTPTEAHRKLWNQLRALGTQSREVHGQALQLLADSEARAVEAALAVEKQWVASLTRDNGILLDAADKTKAGARCVSLTGLLEQANEDLSKERERVRVLEEALEKARKTAYAAPELNMSKYDHEQVQQLNDGMIEVFQILDTALATPERKEGSG